MRCRIACLALVVTAPLISSTITLSITGAVEFSPFSSVPADTSFSGTLSYDPGALPFQTHMQQFARYYLPAPFVIRFPGNSILTSDSGWPNPVTGQGNGSVAIIDDFCCPFPGITFDTITFDGVMRVNGPLAAESPGGQFFLEFLAPISLFSGTHLPNPFPPLSAFATTGGIYPYASPNPAVMGFHVTSLEEIADVPEPSSICTALVALAAAVASSKMLGRRRRNIPPGTLDPPRQPQVNSIWSEGLFSAAIPMRNSRLPGGEGKRPIIRQLCRPPLRKARLRTNASGISDLARTELRADN